MTTSSWIDLVQHGTQPSAPRLVVYGPPGVGKSSLAAAMPDPLIIDYDRGGTRWLGCDRVPGPETWLDTLSLLRWASTSKYKTIAIDTLDPLEEQATTHVCRESNKKTLASFDWGGGFEALAGEWRVMLSLLETSGKNICLLAHSVVRQAQDPRLGAYDQYTPQLQKKTWAATHRWADMIGFVAFDAAKVGDEQRAIVTGARVLYTSKGTGFEAKNRWSMPELITLDTPGRAWEAIERWSKSTPETLTKEIRDLAGDKFGKAAEEHMKAAGKDVGKLAQILSALREKVAT